MTAALRNPALSKYGFQQGLPEFRQAASRWIERRFGIHFDPATETLPLIGSKEGLSHLPFAVINPGDVAIVPEPGYQAYLGGALLAGAEPYIAPLRPENEFLLHLDQIPQEVLRRAKIVFVNYPNNPTAAVATPAYLERTVAVCREHGILLAYDNAYCDLTFDGYRAPSIFETPGARDVALEFFSLSKSYSMTGWRLGFAAGRAELIGALTRVKSYVDTGPFLAVQKAGAAALDAGESLVEPIRAELQRRRDAAVAALRARPASTVESPKAAMYLLGSAAGRRGVRRLCPAGARGARRRRAARERIRSGGRRLLSDCADGGGRPAAAGRGAAGSGTRSGPPRRACDNRLTFICGNAALALDRDRGQRAGAQPAAVRLDHRHGYRTCPRLPRQLIVLAPPAEGPDGVDQHRTSCRGSWASGDSEPASPAAARQPPAASRPVPSCRGGPRR